MSSARLLIDRLNYFRAAALWVGAGGAVLCGVIYLFEPTGFFAGYLTAWLFWLGISLGCLVFLMIHATTGGAWGVVTAPVLQASSVALVIVALASAPLPLGIEQLYPWSRPDVVAADSKLAAKAVYLNVDSFLVRSIACLALWLGLAWVLASVSDSTEHGTARRWQGLAGPGLVIYGFSMTVAGVDWIMSLEPRWYSTMYGVICMASQALGGLSLAIITTALVTGHGPWKTLGDGMRFHDLGSLLLIASAFWAYVVFMQFLLIWSGNLPEEVDYYVVRSQRGWLTIGIASFVLSFVIPCAALLSRRAKERRAVLAIIAASPLAGMLLFWYWLVVPPFGRAGTSAVAAIVALAAIGGFWLALFLGALSRRTLVPLDLPSRQGAIDERSRYAAH